MLIPVILIFTFVASAKAEKTIEVVQTSPIETSLQVPGIRPTLEVWVEMIDAAKETLDIEEFYINGLKRKALIQVIDAIKRAAARGVRVRIIVDSFFYGKYPQDPQTLKGIKNIEVRVINYSKVGRGGVQHAKFFIVDGETLFVGSANFDDLALEHIHEIGLKIKNAYYSDQLGQVFQMDWIRATLMEGSATLPPAPTKKKSGQPIPGIQLLGSPPQDLPPGMNSTVGELIKMIDRVPPKSRIRLQVYEYSTQTYKGSGNWKDLDRALRRAAAHGITIQIMTDHFTMKSGKLDFKSLSQIPEFQIKNVTIPEWSGGHLDFARLIHSKYLTIGDDQFWLGTENWRDSYFLDTRNVGISGSSAEVAGILNQSFEILWNSPYAMKFNPCQENLSHY